MGRSVSARPPADEKPEEPSFKSCKQDPFYLGLRLDVKKARRSARREIDNASRRRRWAADADFRDRRRAGRYGLSLQDYRAILERQGNACAICKKRGRPLCIDHCHVTGQVRGLICRSCNLALGNCNDDPEVLRAAAAYLEAARRDAQLRGDSPQNEGGNGAGAASRPREAAADGEISRDSPEKSTANRMSAASLQPGPPLNTAARAEALIDGRAVVGTAAHPQEGPGTDERAAGHSGLPLT
jgi:hypothetical protein